MSYYYQPQNQNNYFTSMARKYQTDDFMIRLTPEKIQRSAKERIFKEMARGQIDYTQYGKYFLDSKFLSNLIISCENELTNNTVITKALRFYDMNMPGNPLVGPNLSYHYNLCFMYQTILSRLQSLKLSGDIGCLTDIQYVLSGIKNIL